MGAAAAPADGSVAAHSRLVTYTDATGETRPVLQGEDALLTLVRAALADPSRLGRPWRLNAIISLSSAQGGDDKYAGTWSLSSSTDGAVAAAGRSAVRSAQWLQQLAAVV